MRVSKTNGFVTYHYIYDDGQLRAMTVQRGNIDTYDFVFRYGADGRPYSVRFNGADYFYLLNVQGDVVGIANGSGATVVSYVYDAWGAAVYSNYQDGYDQLMQFNPLRYRGYVYDFETGLYYLKTRYYNPTWGRFISPDNYPTTGQGLTGNNMFVYCGNNPVSREDTNGCFWDLVFDIASLVVSVVEVIQNPDDVGAWVGLVLDVVDVAIPFVGGLGETADAVNLSRKAAKAVDNAHDSKKVMSISEIATKGSPNEIGKIGEQLAGIDPHAKIPIQINGRTRIPDAMTETVLTEVKNVKYISNTRQLRDFADYANATGRTLELYVRPTTKVAQTVIDAGWNIKYLW